MPDPEADLADVAFVADPAFEEVLKAAGEPALRRDGAARRLRHPGSDASPLHGTIFARSTWTQAGAAVRKGLNL